MRNAKILLLVLVAVLAAAQTPAPKPSPSKTAVKTEDARLAELLRLNRELLEQHQSYRRMSDDKIKRLLELLNEYEHRLASDNSAGDLRRAQERMDRLVTESETGVRLRSLESQLQRLEQQLRDTQQMLDMKQREVQQLEDRLRQAGR